MINDHQLIYCSRTCFPMEENRRLPLLYLSHGVNFHLSAFINLLGFSSRPIFITKTPFQALIIITMLFEFWFSVYIANAFPTLIHWKEVNNNTGTMEVDGMDGIKAAVVNKPLQPMWEMEKLNAPQYPELLCY